MSRGRPTLPDAIHQLRGTYRADRHGDPDSKVKASAAEPELPPNFGAERTKLWEGLKRELKPLGLWSSTYAIECEMLVRTYHRVLRLEADLDANGEMIDVEMVTKRAAYTVRKKNPALAEFSKLASLVHQQCSTLGLNPSNLAKFQIQPAEGDDLDDEDDHPTRQIA